MRIFATWKNWKRKRKKYGNKEIKSFIAGSDYRLLFMQFMQAKTSQFI